MFFDHFTATLIWSFKPQQQQQQQHSGVTNLNTTNYVIIIINKKKGKGKVYIRVVRNYLIWSS